MLISALFFIVVNTRYFWEGKLDLFAIPVFLFLAIVYLCLALALFGQVFFLIKEKFANVQRLIGAAILALLLTLTLCKPNGLINLEYFEAEDLLIAQREGSANCLTTFKLKKDHTFKERNICFGISEVTGTYRVSKDTIYFENVKRGKQEDKKYEFAVLQKLEKFTENPLALTLFVSKNDTLGHCYFVVKNEMKINPLKTKYTNK